MKKVLDETNADDIAALLEGRRIVHAEMGGGYPKPEGAWAAPEGLLVLDDGTKLYLTGHDGGCSCNAGCYPLSQVAAFDNVITRAEVRSAPDSDDEAGEGVYEIFVFSGLEKVNVATFRGTDGNGYYGTGFSVTVVREVAGRGLPGE